MDASDIKEMRKIIDNINVLNDEWFDTFPTDEGQTSIHDALECEIISADKILSKPPRNCDVGTAEEQTARYIKFCSAHKYLGADFSYMCKGFGKGRCPFFNSHTKSKCELAWAQMPYEEEGDVK